MPVNFIEEKSSINAKKYKIINLFEKFKNKKILLTRQAHA